MFLHVIWGVDCICSCLYSYFENELKGYSMQNANKMSKFVSNFIKNCNITENLCFEAFSWSVLYTTWITCITKLNSPSWRTQVFKYMYQIKEGQLLNSVQTWHIQLCYSWFCVHIVSAVWSSARLSLFYKLASHNTIFIQTTF